jgi:hypothetical protein
MVRVEYGCSRVGAEGMCKWLVGYARYCSQHLHRAGVASTIVLDSCDIHQELGICPACCISWVSESALSVMTRPFCAKVRGLEASGTFAVTLSR